MTNEIAALVGVVIGFIVGITAQIIITRDRKHVCDMNRDMQGNCIICSIEEKK